jgi:hypothetical protein
MGSSTNSLEELSFTFNALNPFLPTKYFSKKVEAHLLADTTKNPGAGEKYARKDGMGGGVM